MKTIKIRNKVYELKPGDYVQDNNTNCLLLVAGDARCLYVEGYTLYTHIELTKKAAKELDYLSLPMKIVYGYAGIKLKRYYIQ